MVSRRTAKGVDFSTDGFIIREVANRDEEICAHLRSNDSFGMLFETFQSRCPCFRLHGHEFVEQRCTKSLFQVLFKSHIHGDSATNVTGANNALYQKFKMCEQEGRP